MKAPAVSVLPRAGKERELLRAKGQFWTPDWVANAMVAYVLGDGSDHLFDPAVGAGAFFRATKAKARNAGRRIRLSGTELHASALEEARLQGLTQGDLKQVQLRDFVLQPPQEQYRSIVANPPFIRHHRIQPGVKAYLRELGIRLMGHALDGRAGLHVYFLLTALDLLAPGGRLAFILPADTCEGVFAPKLWDWITRRFRLDAVVTFEPEAAPFPGVDTNAVIVMIRREKRRETFRWVRCTQPGPALERWIESGMKRLPPGLVVESRDLREALATGLTRPATPGLESGSVLGDFASVRRGIATGANDFFFLTRQQASKLRISPEWLLPAIGRTRDVCGEVLSTRHWEELDAQGRPTLLFSPDGREAGAFPPAIQAYLRFGESLGLPEKALISTRNPWYRMEFRPVPPLLFAYLGRRNARFIRNAAGVIPLTGFLCVYPHCADPSFLDQFAQVLNHPDTIRNLRLVGKSYGGGAIKVEPRALERLPLPVDAMAAAGLGSEIPRQLVLL